MSADPAPSPRPTTDRNLAHLSPRELISEIIGSINIAPDIMLSEWPTTLMQLVHLQETDLEHLLGVTPNRARRLAAAFELHSRLVHWSAPIRPIIKAPSDAMSSLLPYCTHQEERFWCLALDSTQRLIGEPIQISIGDVDGCDAGPRALFRAALKRGATRVVVAHNHPSCDLGISDADLAVTRRLVAAGRTVDVQLLDHIVITADRRWASIRQEAPDCFR